MYIVFYASVNIPRKKLIVFVTFILQLILNLVLIYVCFDFSTNCVTSLSYIVIHSQIYVVYIVYTCHWFSKYYRYTNFTSTHSIWLLMNFFNNLANIYFRNYERERYTHSFNRAVPCGPVFPLFKGKLTFYIRPHIIHDTNPCAQQIQVLRWYAFYERGPFNIINI